MISRISPRRIFAIAALGLTLAAAGFDHADARRGGGFGSRGGRTFHAVPTTPTAPRPVAPVERSMTPRQTQPATPNMVRPAPYGQPARRGFFGGFGRSMLGGLLVGGLIGMLLGHGFGGMAGLFGFLVQIGLIALLVMLAMRFLRRRQPAYTQAGAPTARETFGGEPARFDFRNPLAGSGSAVPAAGSRPEPRDEIGIGQQDLDTFERLLQEIQGAFAREDYAALRERTTPEVASYFSEELSRNATQGLRNDVSDVRLLQGDLAEAWREGDRDYATVAMRYSSVEAMRDRATGKVVEGDPDRPTETTEVWTFARERGGPWKLSAIQDA